MEESDVAGPCSQGTAPWKCVSVAYGPSRTPTPPLHAHTAAWLITKHHNHTTKPGLNSNLG